MPEPAVKDNFLYRKFKESPYKDMSDFVKRSQVPVSFETARKAIYEGRKVTAPVLILIMKYLGFSASEIKKHLLEHGDKDFSDLIGNTKPLTEWEKAYLEIGNTIREKCPEMVNNVIDTISLIARACNVNLDNLIEKIRHEK